MSYLLHIAVVISVYSVLAWSLNLLVGYTGLLSLCHAAFYGLGAYIASLAMVDYGLGFGAALFLAVVGTVALSVPLSVPSLRLRGDYFVLASLGFQAIVFAALYNGGDVTRGPFGITDVPRPDVFGVTVRSLPAFALFALSVASVCGALLYLVCRSPYGRVLRSIRDDEAAAAALGKPVAQYKVSAFAIAAAFAAVAGAVFASYSRYVGPTSFTVNESVFVLALLIVGGAGNTSGPLIGTVVLVLLPEALRFVGLPDAMAGHARQVIYGALIIGLMRFRPQGLAGDYRFS